MKRWVWIALAGVLAVAVTVGVIALQGAAPGGAQPSAAQGGTSLGASPAPPAERAVLVEASPAPRRSIVERAAYHSTLQPRRTVALTPKTGGRVEELLVDVGDRVEAGQALIRLEAVEAEAQVRQAEAALAAARAQRDRLIAGPTAEELEQVRAAVRQARLQFESAERELKRIEELYTKGGVSTQTYESTRTQAALAEAALRSAEARLQALEVGPRREDIEAAEAQVLQAEASLALARTQVANATVRAPFAGVVSQRNAEVGALLSPGVVAVTVADLEELKIVLRVPGREVLRLRPGILVPVTVEGLPEESFQGRIHQIDPVADPQSHLFGVEIRLSDPQGLLRAGLSARVELPLQEREDVVAVPRRAVIERAGRQGVYVVEDGIARFRPLELGVSDPDWVEVRSGLEAGETVVTAGMEFLEPGVPVRIREDAAGQEGRASSPAAER